MAKKRKGHKKNCDCIFCSSKCPQCGSSKIKVTFWPMFRYDNDDEDLIMISRGTDRIDLVRFRNPHPLGVVMWDWLCRSRMGMAQKAAHCYPLIELLPQHRLKGGSSEPIS